MRYRLLRVMGGKGSGPAQFAESLRGVALDALDRVHAVGDCELKIFDSDGTLRQHHRTGKPGICVTVDADGTVYIGQDKQIARFDPDGRLLAAWQDLPRLGLVTEIGLCGDSVLVGDASNRCIRRYDKSGKFLNEIGKNNTTGGFVIPNGHLDFRIDRQGVIHAANSGKHRVERYTLAGELLGHIGRFGGQNPEGFSGCCNPTNVALTGNGRLVVTEKAPPRMKVYDANGKLLWLVDSETFDPNCKNMDIAVDSQDRIYVVDTVRLHICVFASDEGRPKAEPAAQ